MVGAEPKRSASRPDEGRHGAHQQHGKRGAEGEQLAADMQFGRNGLQEDAEALADAETDGEDEETAPNGGPIGTGGHGGQLAVGRTRLTRRSAYAAFHRITSCRHKPRCGTTCPWPDCARDAAWQHSCCILAGSALADAAAGARALHLQAAARRQRRMLRADRAGEPRAARGPRGAPEGGGAEGQAHRRRRAAGLSLGRPRRCAAGRLDRRRRCRWPKATGGTRPPTSAASATSSS